MCRDSVHVVNMVRCCTLGNLGSSIVALKMRDLVGFVLKLLVHLGQEVYTLGSD